MFLLEWLEAAVAWVLVAFHTLLAPIFGSDSGWSWVLSIVGLVVVIRIALIPLFVKQINAQRGMQLIQPRIKEIQKKYAGDREKQSAEMMKIYKETGTNPLASCLPIILQAPIFFALFRVLQGIAAQPPTSIGPLTPELAQSAHDASIFGVPIYATFAHADETPFPTSTKILAVVLIITMSATTFITQRQLIVKNSAPNNPMVKQQKILMYVFPLIFAIGGFNFPIGVLIYWTTTNLWSMGQQFYVIRNNPQPGTPAAKALEERKKAKAAAKAAKDGGTVIQGEVVASETADNSTNKGVTVQNRQQPKRQSKSKRQAPKQTSKKSSGGSSGG
ncbi:MAG: membrane protein insertase YidC [Candidatus Nanopelagicales bacterium]